MGLFKKAIDFSSMGLSGISNAITGKTLGGHAEKLLGIDGSGDAAAQFNPNFSDFNNSLGKINEARDKDITDVRKSTQLNIDQLDLDKAQGLADISSAGQSGVFSALSQLGRTGGVDSGARERIEVAGQKDVGINQQSAISDFARAETGLRSSDFASQQGLKDKALFASPGLSLQKNNIEAQIAAANAQSSSLANAQKKGKLGAIGGLVGGIAGGVMSGGNPVGASAGAGIGSSLFSSFG